MSTSIRGDDSFWAETNAAVDGARAHLSWSGGGVQVFPLHSSRCWKTIILYCTCTKQLSKAHLLFFFSLFFFWFGHERRMTNKRENKKIQKENEQQGELSCPLVERQKTFVRTPSHIARARERERENGRRKHALSVSNNNNNNNNNNSTPPNLKAVFR